MPSKDEKFKEFEKLPFEDALKRLESIVARMEDGKAPLEELLERFEEGAALSTICQKRLDALQTRIDLLVKDGPQPKWKPLDGEEEEPEMTDEPEENDEDDSVKDKKPSARTKKTKEEDLLF